MLQAELPKNDIIKGHWQQTWLGQEGSAPNILTNAKLIESDCSERNCLHNHKAAITYTRKPELHGVVASELDLQPNKKYIHYLWNFHKCDVFTNNRLACTMKIILFKSSAILPNCRPCWFSFVIHLFLFFYASVMNV